ncbi:MAG: molybdopterin-dependent oxidoreductase, partial [Eggerthellaceae bacterium]|nr:molybdopterin-dependent oxidoreductase [Eggerthellaceae bacterium]
EIASYLECKNPVLEGEFEIKGIKVKTCYTALKEHMAKYTKEEAFRISGFSPEHFEELADLYCSGKVITAYTQYGIDHYRGGHLFGQALCILHAITNNLSRPGSGVGGPGSPDGSLYPMGAAMAQYIGTAPIGAANVNNVICAAAMPEVYRTGKYMGQDYPIRGYMGNSENPVSNNANQNGWLKDILPKLELMVMLDNEMTDSCMYADYVLPTAFWLECTDVRGNFCNPYVVYGEKAIEPLFESKTDNEVASLIAKEMGLGDYYPMRTDEELIDIIFNTDFCKSKGITRENLKAKKAIRVRGTAEEPWIIGGYGEEFPTPSGRLELYCEQPGARYEYGQPWQAEAADQHFPVWLEPYENWPGAEIHKKYPLGYLQLHQRGRTHTQWITEPSLREIDPEPLCHMARNDAEARGLKTGDVVEVFNDRGHAVCRMVIDDKVCDGICYIPKGWQRFQFIAGGYQELTNDKNDLCAGGYSFYDAAVEVKKWEE